MTKTRHWFRRGLDGRGAPALSDRCGIYRVPNGYPWHFLFSHEIAAGPFFTLFHTDEWVLCDVCRYSKLKSGLVLGGTRIPFNGVVISPVTKRVASLEHVAVSRVSRATRQRIRSLLSSPVLPFYLPPTRNRAHAEGKREITGSSMAAPSFRLEGSFALSVLPSTSISPLIAAPRVVTAAPRPIPLFRRSLPSPISRRSCRFAVKASSAPPTAEELKVSSSFLLAAREGPSFFSCLFLFWSVMARSLQISTIPTKPVEGQKTGTSGLRKKVLSCFVPSLFDAFFFRGCNGWWLRAEFELVVDLG